MNRSLAIVLGLTITATTLSAAASQTKNNPSLVGSWRAISDEDGTPADFFEITTDGKYINYGFNCTVRNEAPAHTWRGNLYVTHQIPGKGPIAIVFHPNADGSRLTFTSPRTRKNAVYAPIAKIPCLKSPR